MKRQICFSAFVLAGLMAAALPANAWAAYSDTPEFAKTPQEWERLRDNTLEYDEIEDLVHEYNITVLNNRTSYRDYLGDTSDDVAQRYRDAAQELWDSIQYPDDPADVSYATMLMAAQMSETQARNLEQQADNNVDDSQSIFLQYEQVEKGLVLSTKLNLISYCQKQLTDRLNQENKQLLEALYQSAQVQAGVGNATQMDVLTARQTLEQLDSTIISSEKETQTLKQKICLATGWNYDADPVFGALPEIDPAVVDTVNLSADQALALENNYTLKINRRKHENSTDAATKENLEKTIYDNQQKISSDITTKYQSLLNARAAYQLALAEQDIAIQNQAAMERKFATGSASRLEYQQESYNAASKTTAAENAKLALLTAWETYQGAVNGLATAS